jgi:hypothetical protein
MEDLGRMYYFLGLEMRKRLDEIFLSKGILIRFDMMECKSMDTPIETNLKNLSDFSSDSYLVDPTMYMQLIESLMYLVNTMPDIFFAESTLS